MPDSPAEKEIEKEIPKQTMLPEDEQLLLDTALQESDQLLARSLHDDQMRRRWRQVWLSVLVIGVVVMSAIAVGIVSGWLALTGPVVTGTQDRSSSGEQDSTVDRVAQADNLAAAGWRFLQQREFSTAAENFEAAVRLDPQAANAWNGLGWSCFNSGDSEQAVAAFEKCVSLQPRHPAGLNGLGKVYLMWKQYAEAEKYLLLAAPHAPAAWLGLARLYLLQEKFSKAEPWIEQLAGQNPGDETVQQMLKAVAAGQVDDDLRRLIEPPDKPRANSADATRGWAMFQQGKVRIAEQLFRRALMADAENLSALNGLAFCLLNQGNHEQAQPLFEKYLAIEKDAPGPMNGLARCLKANGEVDEAIVLWERMIKLSPGPDAATAGLAQTYLERKEYAKATRHFKELVELDPDNGFFRSGLENAEKGLAANE